MNRSLKGQTIADAEACLAVSLPAAIDRWVPAQESSVGEEVHNSYTTAKRRHTTQATTNLAYEEETKVPQEPGNSEVRERNPGSIGRTVDRVKHSDAFLETNSARVVRSSKA